MALYLWSRQQFIMRLHFYPRKFGVKSLLEILMLYMVSFVSRRAVNA